MKIGAIVRTFFSRFLLLLVVIVYFIPISIFLCLPKRIRFSNKFIFRFVYWFYVVLLKCSLLPVKYIGVENIPDESVIFVANHQSSFDIPLVGMLAGGTPHIWLALKGLLDSPVLRFIVPLFSVLVDMSTPAKGMRSLREILQLMDEVKIKRHAMIFPEGGRYTDGVVHEFFGGFVILAKKTGRPVVPVCILGVDKVYPPNSFLVHWYPITVVVGKPFVYQQGDTDKAFKKRVYQWFVDQTGQKR